MIRRAWTALTGGRVRPELHMRTDGRPPHPPAHAAERATGAEKPGPRPRGDRLAVLIDADNARLPTIKPVLAEVATYGSANVRRAYGDWTGPQLAAWKRELLASSIQPVQQFAYTTGKNASDSAMIIDAMDLLHAGGLDGICLVSSDSDFTRLAQRFREAGLSVYGFGERKTPEAFLVACHRFVHVENLLDTGSDAGGRATGKATGKVAGATGPGCGTDVPTDPGRPRRAPAELRDDVELMELLGSAVRSASDDNGLARLADVGNILRNRNPAFDTRAWGYAKLAGLVAATELFEIQKDGSRPGKGKVIYVRDPSTPT